MTLQGIARSGKRAPLKLSPVRNTVAAHRVHILERDVELARARVKKVQEEIEAQRRATINLLAENPNVTQPSTEALEKILGQREAETQTLLGALVIARRAVAKVEAKYPSEAELRSLQANMERDLRRFSLASERWLSAADKLEQTQTELKRKLGRGHSIEDLPMAIVDKVRRRLQAWLEAPIIKEDRWRT